MNATEILSLILTQFKGIQEISYPAVLSTAAAHEAKPYRDSYLYVNCLPEQWLELAKFLKNDERLSFDFLTMLTAVDYLKTTATELMRMDVVYHLYSFKYQHKMVVKITVPREESFVDSIMHLWPTADWQEREVYDMFGIHFKGHPNCTRILMWDGFTGWPLRKDFVHIPDQYDD